MNHMATLLTIGSLMVFTLSCTMLKSADALTLITVSSLVFQSRERALARATAAQSLPQTCEDRLLQTEANEYYFEGHARSQATWRFHEDGGKREYKLKPRATQALPGLVEMSPWHGKANLSDFGRLHISRAPFGVTGTPFGNPGETSLPASL